MLGGKGTPPFGVGDGRTEILSAAEEGGRVGQEKSGLKEEGRGGHPTASRQDGRQAGAQASPGKRIER